jgi:hypothetical protein
VARLANAGVRIVANDYSWLRATRPAGAEAPSEPIAVLGSALVTDGQIGLEPYLAWIGDLAASGTVAYLPHRRESAEQRSAVAGLAGVRLHETGLPAELVLASALSLRRVVTFPSSAVATLSALLPDSVAVDVRPVPPSWWLPGADPALVRAFESIGPVGGSPVAPPAAEGDPQS